MGGRSSSSVNEILGPPSLIDGLHFLYKLWRVSAHFYIIGSPLKVL
jgi:hypothetical protein